MKRPGWTPRFLARFAQEGVEVHRVDILDEGGTAVLVGTNNGRAFVARGRGTAWRWFPTGGDCPPKLCALFHTSWRRWQWEALRRQANKSPVMIFDEQVPRHWRGELLKRQVDANDRLGEWLLIVHFTDESEREPAFEVGARILFTRSLPGSELGRLREFEAGARGTWLTEVLSGVLEKLSSVLVEAGFPSCDLDQIDFGIDPLWASDRVVSDEERGRRAREKFEETFGERSLVERERRRARLREGLLAEAELFAGASKALREAEREGPCRWCGRTWDEHREKELDGMRARVPCLGLREGFLPRRTKVVREEPGE